MAIYYLNAQVIGRSAGRSATGAAAYRAGERIVDERTGQVFDYTKRRGEIETEIMAPTGAPEWVQDRSQLWNQVEKAERRADAQVAREIVVAFPKELTPGEQRELVRGYVEEQFVSLGMVADVAIHRNPNNPHAHIMLTMREIGPKGFPAKKNREWNRPEMLERWRAEWANHANRALERAHVEDRIDHRSLNDQGSERLPQVHLGPHASALERQGVKTEKGNHNRTVQQHNGVVIDLDKAREQRRVLQAEKVVSDRHVARLQAGWPIPQAKALAQLEYYVCGGSQLSWDQTRDLQKQQLHELHGVRSQLSEIASEEKRLNRAALSLDNQRQAAAHRAALKAPIPTLKRFFSKDAREEYRRTEEQVQHWGNEAQKAGVSSEDDLKEQRSRFERDRAKVPALEEKVGSIGEMLERIVKALDGFAQEQDREVQQRWEHMQRRRRGDRECDSGYDRGR
ncbi:MAG: MobA/MobL family protein [Symbiobacteriaceae bacterium]|jgi:ATP-dependent exoDNAse (exonuclease V) alpha subunit|nr:MobA/MobL family protein [Symbiobacteriaceae bacterium]